MMGYQYRDLPFVPREAKSRKVKHVMRGEFRGRPITLFSYQFTEERFRMPSPGNLARRERGSTTKQQRRRFGVAIVGLAWQTPPLQFSPRTSLGAKARDKGLSTSKILGQQAAGMLGHAVDLGDESFDSEFVVRTRDLDFARRILTDDVRAWLLKSKAARRYTVVLRKGEILVFSDRFDVEAGQYKATFLNDFLDRVPQEALTKPAA
jgi:hypothetical protein